MNQLGFGHHANGKRTHPNKLTSITGVKRKRDDFSSKETLDKSFGLNSTVSSIFNGSTMSLNILKVKKFASMTRLFTSKLTRNKNSISSPLQASKKRKIVAKKEPLMTSSGITKTRPSISSPRLILTPKRRFCTTPLTSMNVQQNNPITRQTSRLWIESVSSQVADVLSRTQSHRELKRQEAVHELLAGELGLCQDLALIETTYQNSLIHLGILDESEAFKIFGNLHVLSAVHYSLVRRLNDCRDGDGVYKDVGPAIVAWVDQLNIYQYYCSNQRTAKELLTTKIKTDKKMSDFLERCIQSPFSRKLDLWSFLDVPRARLVKYPLLLQAIRKYTPEDTADYDILGNAIKMIEIVAYEVDLKMGEADCKVLLAKIEYDKNILKNFCLNSAKNIVCSGNFKTQRGTKLFCILFDSCFVATKSNETDKFSLYHDPIPVQQLRFECCDPFKANTSFRGSFRGSFRNSLKVSNLTLSNSKINYNSALRIYSVQADCDLILHPTDNFVQTLWLKHLKASTKSQCSINLETSKFNNLTINSPKKKIKFCNENSFNELLV